MERVGGDDLLRALDDISERIATIRERVLNGTESIGGERYQMQVVGFVAVVENLLRRFEPIAQYPSRMVHGGDGDDNVERQLYMMEVGRWRRERRHDDSGASVFSP